VGYVPVNDCAPFAVAWEKGFFRKYGLNVTLSREASWANSRDGIIFGRLDASPVVSGAITNARTGQRAAGCPSVWGDDYSSSRQRYDYEPANVGFWLRPWREYNGNLEQAGKQLQAYFQSIPQKSASGQWS
jgi:nitrate/nitrite transport system substrate-binding protein